MTGPIAELALQLAKLPGLGRRSAMRAALQLVREKGRLAEPLLLTLKSAMDNVVCCSRCGAFTTLDADPCPVCTDMRRDSRILCVVEEPSDIVQIEASGAFAGRYHALGGKLSPVKRMGPERLRIASLVERIAAEGFEEVLLALSTDMEGDATAGYVSEVLKDCRVKVTRLAFGLPADSGVAYSDPLTLRRAINNRVSQ